jgi:hypothetical protein
MSAPAPIRRTFTPIKGSAITIVSQQPERADGTLYAQQTVDVSMVDGATTLFGGFEPGVAREMAQALIESADHADQAQGLVP